MFACGGMVSYWQINLGTKSPALTIPCDHRLGTTPAGHLVVTHTAPHYIHDLWEIFKENLEHCIKIKICHLHICLIALIKLKTQKSWYIIFEIPYLQRKYFNNDIPSLYEILRISMIWWRPLGESKILSENHSTMYTHWCIDQTHQAGAEPGSGDTTHSTGWRHQTWNTKWFIYAYVCNASVHKVEVMKWK